MNSTREQTWQAPPNWPPPPAGWSPPPGWRWDPAWGPAPEGWRFATESAPEVDETIVDDVEHLLRCAADAGSKSDVVAEERHLASTLDLVDRVPLLSRLATSAWIGSRIATEVRAGRIRRGARALGVVQSAGFGDDDLHLFSDRVVYGKEVHPVDARVSAAVEMDGQLVVSHRPTLTRGSLGDIRPPAPAFQNSRVASFMLAHPEWTLSLRIPTTAVRQARALALQLNRIADDLRVAEEPPGAGTDSLSRLERIGNLLSQGVITADQASALRDEVLRGG